MKYYYLSKPKLINEEIQVMKTSGVILSEENADALFGVGGWVCYYGEKLPARMRFDTTTNKIVVLTDDAPKKHLYAGVSLLEGVVTEDKFDPAMFVRNDDLNFLTPLKLGGTPAFTYPNKSYFMTFKMDGTPVSDLMKVISDQFIQVTPSNIDAYFGRSLVAEGNIISKGYIEAPDIRTTTGISMAGLKTTTDNLSRDISNLQEYVNSITDVVPPGVIAMFHTGYIPYGWTVCDGRAVAVNAMTAEYRRNIGSVTPDMRGYFVRGWDGGSGRNYGRGPNHVQTDAGRNVTGWWLGAEDIDWHGSWDGGGAVYADHSNGSWAGIGDADSDNSRWVLDASRVWGAEHTANEFRPVNYSVIFAIKTHKTLRN